MVLSSILVPIAAMLIGTGSLAIVLGTRHAIYASVNAVGLIPLGTGILYLVQFFRSKWSKYPQVDASNSEGMNDKNENIDEPGS